MNWTLNKTEILILEILMEGSLGIGDLSKRAGASISWTSECVSHLKEMSIVEVSKSGRSKTVDISSGKLGESFRVLISQNKNLRLDYILTDSGLKILPYLLGDGSTMKEISEWASISYRMVQNYIDRWKSMGVAYRKKDRNCVLNPLVRDLKYFIEEFLWQYNRQLLNSIYPEGIILWEEWKEFLFVADHMVDNENLMLAGPTLLNDQGFDIVASKYYYQFSKKRRSLSIEEAMIQNLVIDTVNPRPRRLIYKGLKDGEIRENVILEYAKIYGVEREISQVVD